MHKIYERLLLGIALLLAALVAVMTSSAEARRDVRGYVQDALAPSAADLATVLTDYPEGLSP
jgi:hypothetical protein